MNGPRGATLGSGGVTDGYEGIKRSRMMEPSPYFAGSSGANMDGFDIGTKRPRMMDQGSYFPLAALSSSYQSFNRSSVGRYGSMNSFPVVRMRGIPFDCDDADIIKFFMGLDIVDCLLVNKKGRFSGEAFVIFASPVQADLALQRDRQNMGRRYIEVFPCNKQEYYHAIAAEVNNNGVAYFDEHHDTPAPVRPKRPSDDKDKMGLQYTEVLKLRGLPYAASKSDIIGFFGDFELTEDKVHIGYRMDGKATGEAFVEFPSADAAKKAMGKDKMSIGSRYVELFPSTPGEAKKATERSI